MDYGYIHVSYLMYNHDIIPDFLRILDLQKRHPHACSGHLDLLVNLDIQLITLY